ncbi:arginine utilization regulatory protein [Keratinibaculum paraultunense]|uniref:Arginine utilization regulatory protein n=1 Tax=Keratinibaculum paraultunense TaxID=1278232 RepID=A0A4V2UUK5_9FIRM|nr:sigma 54-interacting transcriptional regulator [Keratinibaculum paraultunense]QQY80549.1 sigma 54-interacting transcriptional regulator [Keratinibaculum paraultunense]TCS91274.1 arginine utilization regulatory protein [Keratinibaculum paraultunense]
MGKVDLNKIILQNILNHVDIGIHVIDENRKTILYNEAMSKLEGLDIKQVMNKDLLQVFPSLNEDSSTLIKVLNTGESILDETQSYLNYEGKKITTINSTIPLLWKGEILGALEISKDITYLEKLSNYLIELQQELKENNYDNKENKKGKKKKKKYTFKDIIGKDEQMLKAIKIAKKARNSPSSVLLYGETGTGKELFAQSIHYGGIRRNRPFIAQNCAAIPEALLEGILFGTEKGGFTGAIEREGIFEQADGGTLLLDEINSMSLGLQAKLLRVLQEEYIRRIGGVKDIPIDVKIIATTNEDPLESVKKGTLRRDLYYRLNVVYIKIPPLRERQEDIPILCDYFIRKYNPILNKNIIGIEDEVLEYFFKYSWPGNVRELENAIEGAMNYVDYNGTLLKKEHFVTCPNVFDSNRIYVQTTDFNIEQSLPEYLDNIEKDVISNALEKNDYNISQTAKQLGIKRQALQYKMKKYSL